MRKPLVARLLSMNEKSTDPLKVTVDAGRVSVIWSVFSRVIVIGARVSVTFKEY